MDGEKMPILAYILFKVASGTEVEVAQKIIEFEETIGADVVFGEYDVIARVAIADLGKLQDFVSDRIRAIPNILVTTTMIISKEYKGKNSRSKK